MRRGYEGWKDAGVQRTRELITEITAEIIPATTTESTANQPTNIAPARHAA